MKKSLRRKFVIFAMSAVTVLLIVLIGAISVISHIILNRQTSAVLHAIVNEDFSRPGDEHDRIPFMIKPDMDTIRSARFFTVKTDLYGNIIDINTEQISSVTEEQAKSLAERITDTNGKIDRYKYEAKTVGRERIIFFMDTSSQLSTTVMVISVSAAIAVLCWLMTLIFVILLSGRAVRPVILGMEKQKQFITNAGHELKTPLTIIGSNNDASALIYGETKYSQNIRIQTKRLSALMANLLTLAKLDEEIELPRENVEISKVAFDMIATYDEILRQKDITQSIDIAPNVTLFANADALSQMMSILIDNAAKYTPNGGSISFSVKNRGEHVEITEENTCDTSNIEDAERLFDRFYRVSSARTQDGGTSGYGIGLSAARAIAESFGGTLKAEIKDVDKIRFTARF